MSSLSFSSGLAGASARRLASRPSAAARPARLARGMRVESSYLWALSKIDAPAKTHSGYDLTALFNERGTKILELDLNGARVEIEEADDENKHLYISVAPEGESIKINGNTLPSDERVELKPGEILAIPGGEELLVLRNIKAAH